MTFIQLWLEEALMAEQAWAHARISGSAAEAARALPDLIGASGTHLSIRRPGEPLAPPRGSIRFPARWRRAKDGGEATLTLMPVSIATCEIDVAVSRPRSLAGSLRWRGRRLERLADDLAAAVAAASARVATRETARRRPAASLARNSAAR